VSDQPQLLPVFKQNAGQTHIASNHHVLRRTRIVRRHFVGTLNVFNFLISKLKLPAHIVVDEAGALEPHVLEGLTAQSTFVLLYDVEVNPHNIITTIPTVAKMVQFKRILGLLWLCIIQSTIAIDVDWGDSSMSQPHLASAALTAVLQTQ